MAILNFTPSACGMMSAPANTSEARAIPGGAGPTLLITNLGPSAAVVLLGGSTVVATVATGIAVLPGCPLALGVGANTHIAAWGLGGNATLNLAQGDATA
jgi:hypothetical protein